MYILYLHLSLMRGIEATKGEKKLNRAATAAILNRPSAMYTVGGGVALQVT